jgi:hypothetical protein
MKFVKLVVKCLMFGHVENGLLNFGRVAVTLGESLELGQHPISTTMPYVTCLRRILVKPPQN